jgi:hypothetical protein
MLITAPYIFALLFVVEVSALAARGHAEALVKSAALLRAFKFAGIRVLAVSLNLEGSRGGDGETNNNDHKDDRGGPHIKV